MGGLEEKLGFGWDRRVGKCEGRSVERLERWEGQVDETVKVGNGGRVIFCDNITAIV